MSTNLVTIPNQTALARLLEVAQASVTMPLAKYAKGEWTLGGVAENGNRAFIAHVDQTAHGWLKFVGGKVVEERMGPMTAYTVPAREDLGDNDPNLWPMDGVGIRQDPWVGQQYLPLEDKDTGELFKFATSSQGGRSAIAKLLNVFVRNVHKGLPIVHLDSGEYHHKTFGKVLVPEFVVDSWTGAAAPISHEPPPYDGPTFDPSEESPF